ncbi:MAG: hypothetical protein KBF56_06455, partial [Gemmatimonadaceae bacterium]|nr:hypothetical protein [Gemmatimonadaceae bacterium]
MSSVASLNSTPTSSSAAPVLTRGRIVSLGVWAGFLSGVGEGIAHAAARGVPTIQSPYKVSL